jgi:hypothetical protein
LVIPRFGKERLYNKIVLIVFITKYINIPIPKLYYCFENNKAIYLIIEYIKRIGINKLKKEKRKFIKKELEVYLEVLKEIKLKFWRGPSGIIYCLY